MAFAEAKGNKVNQIVRFSNTIFKLNKEMKLICSFLCAIFTALLITIQYSDDSA